MKEKIFNWGVLIINLLSVILNIYVCNLALLIMNLAGAALSIVVLADIYNEDKKWYERQENNQAI